MSETRDRYREAVDGAYRMSDREIDKVIAENAHSPEFMGWLDRAYRNGSKGDAAKFTKWNMEVAYLAGKQYERERCDKISGFPDPRTLITFRTSNNAHGYTNSEIQSAKVDALPDVAKRELANVMVNIALGLDPENEIIAAKVTAERERCADLLSENSAWNDIHVSGTPVGRANDAKYVRSIIDQTRRRAIKLIRGDE